MSRLVRIVVALSVLAACAQDKQTVENTDNQSPSNPTGTIVGRVTSLRTGQPLAGVTVTVPATGGLRSTTTDSSGAYSLGGLVAGATYEVRFALANHVTGLGAASIPSTAGDFPSNGIAQLDVALAQANATLNGHVYARDGAPAQGVVLTADLRAQGFDFVASATTDAQGAYALIGLPGAPTGLSLDVVAQPWDQNGDGLADYDALTKTTTTYPAATSLLDFDLRLAAADLLLLASNVDSGSAAPDVHVRLTFNRQLDPTLTTVTLRDQTASRFVAVTTALDATAKILTVAPAGGATLSAYHTYVVAVNGVATNGAPCSVSRTFSVDVAVPLLAAVEGLTVTPATADYDTRAFTLSWTSNANASGYQIWARDTNKNPSWLLLDTVANSFTPSATETLPGSFDYYGFDGIQTPLAAGVGVDFAVVAVNATGDAPSPTTAAPVRRIDTVLPTVVSAPLSGNADNSGGSAPRTITLTLNFSEYMDPTSVPSIVLPVSGEAATFAWSATNKKSGAYTIAIPAYTDGRGRYLVLSAKDTSGNVMTPWSALLTGTVQLVVNGGFETGDPSGWTTTYTGTATAPIASSAYAATGTWSARVGNTTGSAQTGTSALYQLVTLPTGYASIVASASYRPYTNYPYPGWDTSSCLIQNSAGTVTLATIFTTYANSSSFTTSSVNIAPLAGQTVRVTCQTIQKGLDVTGMYLDDVSIVASP